VGRKPQATGYLDALDEMVKIYGLDASTVDRGRAQPLLLYEIFREG